MVRWYCVIFLYSYGLCKCIKDPTSITETSVTCLDPIFVSSEEIFLNSGRGSPDNISDHNKVITILHKPTQTFIENDNFNQFKTVSYTVM